MRLRLWVLAMAVVLMHAIASAVSAGELSGVVTDLTGIAIAEAAVIVKSRTGAELARTTTDADGRYRLSGIEPGQRHLTIELAGFVPFEQDVNLGERTVINAGLWVSPLSITYVHVRGVVRDTEGKPLPSAAVVVAAALRTDRAEHGTTDARGRFDVQLSNGGWFMVIGSMACYQPSVAMVSVGLLDDKLPDVTLTLQKTKTKECK